MAPTMEMKSVTPPSIDVSWAAVSDHRTGRLAQDSSNASMSSSDNSTCQVPEGSIDITACSRSVIPEASPVFRETMNKMKMENAQRFSHKANAIAEHDADALTEPAAVATVSATSPSFLSKIKSAFKTSTSTISSQMTPNPSRGLPSRSSSTNKTGSSRRPASFGGSDVVKPCTERRASNYEKRVSWADERGSDHPLFSVRLIRPRLSTESTSSSQITPGHSILRNSGIF